MDTNGDGSVSQDEYIAAAKARFAKLDKNGDGFIEADEMPAHHWAHTKHPPTAAKTNSYFPHGPRKRPFFLSRSIEFR